MNSKFTKVHREKSYHILKYTVTNHTNIKGHIFMRWLYPCSSLLSEHLENILMTTTSLCFHGNYSYSLLSLYSSGNSLYSWILGTMPASQAQIPFAPPPLLKTWTPDNWLCTGSVNARMGQEVVKRVKRKRFEVNVR